ncbi:hypothetical protein [Streptomyces sp. IBSBF 3136]|uniref:hypothetical protein n=1 Tax=Streptomyces sp. IBSBF 3136 TaxID=2903524 RepID=UPI002FDBA423
MTQPIMSVEQLLILEYQQLKDEQRSRIGFRDNLLYATLASMAAVVIAATQAGRTALVLMLPAACLVLGWTYLVNDEKVSAIGRYVREELGPRLGGATDAGVVFGWESAHRGGRRRHVRKVLQLVVDVSTFCGTAAAALVVYWCAAPLQPALLVVSIAELAAVVVLGWQMALYADVYRDAAP